MLSMKKDDPKALSDKTKVEIVGEYPIDAPEPCHLIEIIVRGSKAPFDIGGFTQPVPGQPESNWQVPWDECVLDSTGETIVADYEGIDENPALLVGDVRMAFFFHYLNLSVGLITPFGTVSLPAASPLPSRLKIMKYEEPG